MRPQTAADPSPRPFDRELLRQPTLEAARALLGARLVRNDERGRRVGVVTEVEAYIGEDDLASHARFGRTARNEIMYGLPGRAYVYLVYGMYDCLNVVTEPVGQPAAVLIRAVTPTDGVDLMRAARIEWASRRRKVPAAGEPDRIGRLPADRLASGPGLVCAAFGIDRGATGMDLCEPGAPLRLEAAGEAVQVASSPRIGVRYAGAPWTDHEWRFYVPGEPSVSGAPRR